MHYVYRASLRVEGKKMEHYYDSRQQAANALARLINEQQAKGIRIRSAEITAVQAAGGETARDYNHPYEPRIW